MKNRIPIGRVAVMTIVVAGISGCANNGPSQPQATQQEYKAVAELSPVQVQQKQLAIAAKDKLFESLFAELMKSMGESGPAKSISVCKTRAPEIAKSVGEETGVRIGRTSFKIRNPDNESPEWAIAFVDRRLERPVEVALPDDALGVLLPIHLKATCILCHGTDEQLSPDVKFAIEANYPDDNATGFGEGDLRGYFWIEVPRTNPP